MDDIRIYVASLADYNDGNLHGAWIDANQSIVQILTEIGEMLEASPFAKDPWAIKHGLKAEEWAIHDYEGFGSIRLREYDSIERVATIARGIAEYGDAYIAWVEDTGSYNPDDFADAFIGDYDDVADFGYRWFDDTLGVERMLGPLGVEYYVDWAGYGENLLNGTSHSTYNNRLYVYA